MEMLLDVTKKKSKKILLLLSPLVIPNETFIRDIFEIIHEISIRELKIVSFYFSQYCKKILKDRISILINYAARYAIVSGSLLVVIIK